MKGIVKELWLNALRSGEYGQAEGRLKDSSGRYCCLGVLCELYRQDQALQGKEINWIRETLLEQGGVPHNDIVVWAGLPNDNPTIGKNKDTLSNLNDGCNAQKRRHSFKEIADIIEAHIPGVVRKPLKPVQTTLEPTQNKSEVTV